MYPYLTKEDTLKTFRALVEKLRTDRWSDVLAANPVLHYALELHFGSFNDAARALNIDASTREGWRVYWEEARKRGYTQRKQLEELKRDSPQPNVIALPDATDRVEQVPEFLSCRCEHDIKILALCVIGVDRIMDPGTNSRLRFSHNNRFLHRFIHPLMRRLAEHTGIPLDASVTEPADQSLLALFDLCDELGIDRKLIQDFGRELGTHIPWQTAARPMGKELLHHARQTQAMPRLVDLLVTEARKRLDWSLADKADRNQDFTDVREALDRAKARIMEGSWAEARQQVLWLLDTLLFTKEQIAAAVTRIGLPKVKKSISRRGLCCHLFDAAAKHGRLDAVLNVLEDELRRQVDDAREEQTEREKRLAEERAGYLGLLGVLSKEAGLPEPDLGYDNDSSEIEHRKLIELLVDAGQLLGYCSDKEFAHERFIYDVVWRRIPTGVPSHVFEVQVRGNVTEALARLKSASEFWNSRLFLVADSKDTEKARWTLSTSFPDIAQSVRFLTPADVAEYVDLKRRLVEFERRFIAG
jgi:hypothetical protein